jgi:hypothetical protein
MLFSTVRVRVRDKILHVVLWDVGVHAAVTHTEWLSARLYRTLWIPYSQLLSQRDALDGVAYSSSVTMATMPFLMEELGDVSSANLLMRAVVDKELAQTCRFADTAMHLAM